MKKIFSLILVAMLSLSPIYAFATEDTPLQTPAVVEGESTPVPSEEPAPTEEPTPAESEPTHVTEPTTTEKSTTGEVPVSDPETSSEEKLNTEGTTDDNSASEQTSSETVSDEPTVTDSETKSKTATDTVTDQTKDSEKTVIPKRLKTMTTDKSSDKETTSTEEKTSTDLTEDDKSEEELTDADKDATTKDVKIEIPEHVHEYTYVSNENGTHTVKCIAPLAQASEDGTEIIEGECDYEEIEDCTYDENKKCIYCGYVKPKDAFEPSVSVSISNQTCTIGQNDPVICLTISQEDFDIEFAQICFANYSNNQYINVALGHGMYFNHKSDSFEYLSDDNWYASPDITDEYSPGKFNIRSFYIRSVTGESVHYSIESGNLNEAFQNISIELTNPTPLGLLKDYFSSGNDKPEALPEELPEKPVYDETADEIILEETLVEEPSEVVDESKAPTTIAEESKEPETPITVMEEPKVPEAPAPVVEKPKSTQPAVEEKPAETKPSTGSTSTNSTTNKSTNKSSNSTQNNTTNNTQQNNNNSIFSFLKKLFGLK
ncbi:hypothetical protein SAMN02910384_00622 [Pseudobutyrivibrio sp. ACV-2]|uniref:hypothetical protein n=1 Tax=Pseudobutyrivibrio sp. ACV-2 TaxID=1520801 RepID=UPI00089A32B5|nr:hypothetical protein [Pseudobutyrivibrio sp. ACV-2]SEA01414.1 hypothetical protein SAMN02910384_00622 [Pseudobutyrivibrio sp. ACV-2]